MIPTLLLGTSLGKDLVVRNYNATYVAYPHLSGTPDLTFTEENFFSAVADGHLFIRKRPKALTDSVVQFLEARCGLTRSLLDVAVSPHLSNADHRTDVAAEPDIDDLINHIQTRISNRFTGMVVCRIGPELALYVPRFYVVLRHPAWSPQVVVGVVSEDLLTFKVVLTWQEHGRPDLNPVTVGPSVTSIMKVRVHGLAYEREVLVQGDATRGFVVTESRQDWDWLAQIVCLYLDHAAAFSAILRSNAAA